MYFDKLIETLQVNNTEETRLKQIINPFTLYFICNHYYGDEPKRFGIKIPDDKNDILTSNNLNLIKDYDIIHCEVSYFESFCKKILCNINKKIILTTGQWQLPQIKKSIYTEQVINNKNVVLWISQNPIYENSDKYIAFPYGIAHHMLEAYSNILLKQNIVKSKEIINLPINNNTNECRKKLPVQSPLSPQDFYTKMAEAKFVISPIGDRDDCYRHYEAIGLETVPISNVDYLYNNIFGKNMYYTDIDTMVELSKTSHKLKYNKPTKDLICSKYHIDNIKKIIQHIILSQPKKNNNISSIIISITFVLILVFLLLLILYKSNLFN
jgi:hypothetical protein